MNVLLIYPKFPDTFWSFKYALTFIRKKAANPPLGLLTVAAMLPDEFQKRLVDMNVDCLSDEDIRWADMAFIGGMAVQRGAAKQIITQCKRRRTAFHFGTGCIRGGGPSRPRRGRTHIAVFS